MGFRKTAGGDQCAHGRRAATRPLTIAPTVSRALLLPLLITLLTPLLMFAAGGGAARAGADGAALAALTAPGAVGVMRHALAPGYSDPSHFKIDDCSTQRNLDAAGRAQARATGAALRAAGVGFDLILTSQWCRCRETARLLGLGLVRDLPALNSFFEHPGRAPRQTAALRATLAGLPAGQRVLLVSHYVNIADLTGQTTASGEILVARRGGDGTLAVTGRFVIAP